MISKALVVGAYHKKAEEIAKRGIRLTVVVPQAWGDHKPEIESAAKYSIRRLPCVFSGHNHFHFYPGLNRCVEEERPDLIHIDEESYSFVTFHAMGIARRHRIPALFFNWQNILKEFPFPFSSFERYQFRYAAAAIAGSEEVRSVLMLKGCRKPISVIPQFGVDPNIFRKRSNPVLKRQLFGKGRPVIIGFGGRLVEEKGILLLLEAFSSLPPETRLLLLGSGPLKEAIIQRARALHCEDRLVIREHVPSQEVPKYLNCMDCLVLPSLTRKNWKEQFGRILIEAMSCEVPVVGSDSGEIPSVIGDAGIVVREGDIDGLRSAIAGLMKNKAARLRFGRRGRMRVVKHFTQARIAEETVSLYRSVGGRP